ncbi:hypothetical protein HU200_007497 [Digitaria exilis]|uniref:Uncharacterized protein n=1 Tax=Digitaria exilis TaxID=1010633 RepID=A0A835FND4_9POAL|nr:hypothetical protein HU200_007497 [Digitaria exilis]
MAYVQPVAHASYSICSGRAAGPGAPLRWPELGRHVAGERRKQRRAGRAAVDAGACRLALVQPLPCHHVAAVESPRLAPRNAIMPVARRRGRTRARATLRALQAAIPSRYAPTHPVDDPPAARKDLPRQPSRSRSVQAPSASMARHHAQASHRAIRTLHSLAHLANFTSPRSLRHLLPRAARTEPSFAEKFSFHTPPFPNSSRTKLDLYPSSISPTPPELLSLLRREIKISPKSRFSAPSPRSTEHAISFLELHWCSRTLQTPTNASDLTGVAVAAAAPPPLLPRPPNRPQPTRGEPLMLFPHFPDPSSPPFGRRNSGEKGAIPDGNYHLIPADEEGVPEEGAGEGSTNPEANPQLEQDGKPRSMT